MKRALVLAGAALAAIPPWVFGTDAWPEMVANAYFTLHGRVLYQTIIFPHTPLLILTIALLAKVFGFSAILFRSIIAGSMAAGGALIVASGRRPLLALAVGVPVFMITFTYTMGVSLWPDPLMAPVVLLGALALERNEQRKGALILGICILIKQTSAFFLVGAILWLIVVRRERFARVASFVAWASLPYAVFVVAWGLIYRTTAHVYWTLIMPLSGHAGEIALVDRGSIPKAILLLFIVLLFLVVVRDSWRSPLPWVALAGGGMAWPEFGLQHFGAITAILAVMAVDCAAAARKQKLAAVLLAIGIVGILADLPWWRVGGDVLFWDDPGSTFFAGVVRRRIPPGGAFLNVHTPFENLYALTNTTSAVSIYLNPRFSTYFSKRGVGDAYCRELASRHGALVLFTPETAMDDPRMTQTCAWKMVVNLPVEQEVASPWVPSTTWRCVP